MEKLSVILPTYNEADNVSELIERLEASLKGFDAEIIFVDDGSPDGTADLAESIGSVYGNVRVIRRPKKMGLTSAVLDGVKLARSNVVAVMDADLQHPPELLPKMYMKIMEGYDLVVASRYVKGGRVEDWGPLRRLISWGATKLAHIFLLSARGVKDIMSGYFMLRRSILEHTKLNPKGYKILLEILAKCKVDSVAEVPYTFKPRRRGKSKLNFGEIISYLLLLLRLCGSQKVGSQMFEEC
ncbi:MAG: polyprenol monophosphomannose synthase [Candidatus Korarchaeota archaeon]|nr:polyprenol monophosphomannose synthase [Thermoproteota archaeon]